jgi:hypothetical protein
MEYLPQQYIQAPQVIAPHIYNDVSDSIPTGNQIVEDSFYGITVKKNFIYIFFLKKKKERKKIGLFFFFFRMDHTFNNNSMINKLSFSIVILW